MAGYQCPRCNGPVSRGSTGAVSRQFGLVGALIGLAVAGFSCVKCGAIPKSEFPADVRGQMGRNSAFMIIGAIAVFAAAIAVLVALN